MAFLLKPAIRDKINLLFAIAGASGSGKTYSALLLAQGIAGENGKIAVIDTEAGRALQYAPKNNEPANPEKGTFDFFHLDFQPNFSPERYTQAIETCEKAGATVIVIDSASHEWNGTGGVSETAEQTLLAKATNKDGSIDYQKLNSAKLLSWAEPKKQHKKMMAKLTQVRSHIIFCLRAEEKVKMGKENGKTTIIPTGFQPICEKGFMFEMTASMTMTPTKPGCPDYDLDKKLNNDMQAIFANQKCITIEHGRRLKQWAETGDISLPTKHTQSTQSTLKTQSHVQNNLNEKQTNLEIRYDRLSHALQDVESREKLERITGHAATIELRAELKAKEPQWAGIINDLVNQAVNRFNQEENISPGQFDDSQGVFENAS